MDHKYEEGDIVMYKKDNEIYKIEQIVKTGNVVSGIAVDSFTIGNDNTRVNLVYAKDLELL